MQPRIIAIACAAAFALVFSVGAKDNPSSGIDWPSFRGPFASGIAEGFPTPLKWDVGKAQNVEWKTPIPGMGHSSPVVIGDKIFITTAIRAEGKQDLKVGMYGDITPVTDSSAYTWNVYCLDKKTGRILWERTAHTGVPKIKRHPKSTHANPTPAADGTHVVAFFGSEGLYCYDFDGNLLWSKDLGLLDSAYYVVPSAQFGTGSSPVMYEDAVYLQCDVLNDSFVAAFSLKDGKEIWRTPRSDVPTWSTPTIHKAGDQVFLFVNGYREAAGYDAKTGKRMYQKRLGSGAAAFTATGIAANGKLYYTSEDGDVYAVKAGPEFELLATNPIGEVCIASPAISEGTLYFRTVRNLIAIREK